MSGCTKTLSFKTQRAAWRQMRRIKQKDTGQVPLRIYWCKEHKAYHFTSKPKLKGNHHA